LKYTNTPLKGDDRQEFNIKVSNNQPWSHKKIAKSNKMIGIFHFLSKNVSKIEATSNVRNTDEL
jgi:hypothetical protein